MAQKKSLISENEETIYSVKLGFQILERWGGYGSKTDPFRVPSFKIQKKKKRTTNFGWTVCFLNLPPFPKRKGRMKASDRSPVLGELCGLILHYQGRFRVSLSAIFKFIPIGRDVGDIRQRKSCLCSVRTRRDLPWVGKETPCISVNSPLLEICTCLLNCRTLALEFSGAGVGIWKRKRVG